LEGVRIIIDPTYELLWKTIAEAYQQVANNAERKVVFEHDKYSVSVVQSPVEKNAILIKVSDDVEVKPPTLIAP
jgi:hypothetical protein